MSTTFAELRSTPIATAAVIVAAGGAATILGAYFFQYVIGLKPCPLCLEQRFAYYFAIPLALMALLGASFGASRRVLIGALVVIAAIMLWNAGLGGYHAGVEWKWWEGPRDCTGDISSFGNAGDLLRQMQTTSLVRCDEIPWSFLGLSLAGYNALISLVLAIVAGWGALTAFRQPGAAEGA